MAGKQASGKRGPGAGGVSGPVTLRVIADKAGVHVSTVSRALNPLEAHRVGAGTAEAIRSIAAELGYEPHHWARSLRTNRTMMLGLIIPRLSDNVLAFMFEAADEEARRHGYHAVTMSTFDDPEEERRIVRALLDRRVDGLILASCRRDDDVPEQLAGSGVPYVLLNRAVGAHPCVRGDDEEGGYLATRHLVEQGHRRIGLIAGPPDVSTARYRHDGYRRALAEAGIEPGDDLVVHSAFTGRSGYDACCRLLSVRERPTAVFAVNDATAIGAMAAASTHRVRVPEDLAVVGYNDVPMSAMLPIPLTSVALPLADMGRLAVGLLLEAVQGGAAGGRVFPAELRVRGSSVAR